MKTPRKVLSSFQPLSHEIVHILMHGIVIALKKLVTNREQLSVILLPFLIPKIILQAIDNLYTYYSNNFLPVFKYQKIRSFHSN